jgi:Ca2+/H+ antiporter, TMEM165/GDT1 family
VVLAALVLALGTSLATLPLPLLQLVIGALLLMFGLRWLRKAVLRQAGVLPLHDEAEAFAKETERLRRTAGGPSGALDKMAVATTFKTVMLEGIEVVFIVIALGSGGRLLVPAAVGAALALAVVLVLGVRLHRPLARVPENALKFAVGIMLTSFGIFWAGEGIGVDWPGGDAALPAIIGFLLLASAAIVVVARNGQPAEAEA